MTTDLGPAATLRPVPSPEARMRDARTDHLDVANKRDYPTSFATYLDATERDQLDARAATAEQERDEALDDRDAYKEARDVAQQLATVRQGVIDALNAETMVLNDTIRTQAAELGAAGDVLAVVRDAVERIDRALAVYDTTPGEPDCPTCRDTGLAVVGQQFNGRPVHANCPECGIGAEREDTPHEPGLGSLPPRAQDDLVDRLAAALAVAARTHDGSGVRPGTPDIWRALLAEHTDVRHLATHRRRGMFGRPAGTWRPASPGDTPGELTPEHGPTHPIQLAREQPAPVCSHGRSTFTPPTDGVPRHVDSWLPCDDYAPSEREG